MAAGIMLLPTSIADLMAIADEEKIMPPKSTWFEPKLADGLLTPYIETYIQAIRLQTAI